MIDLDRIAEILQIEFLAETTVTLGGFLTEYAQKLLKVNECIFYQGFCFMIKQANDKRIIQVHIKKTDNKEECSTITNLKKDIE